MFRHRVPKLALNRETVRQLTGTEQRAIVGGLLVFANCKTHHCNPKPPTDGCSAYCPSAGCPTLLCPTKLY